MDFIGDSSYPVKMTVIQTTQSEQSVPIEAVITPIIEALQDKPGALLPILHGIQEQLGFVPGEAVPLIASSLNLSRADVHGVISFYHFFRSSPPGRHVLQICRAESCQAMGSRALEAHARNKLKIDYHQTTADGEISLEPVYCLGNCACSPALRVDDAIFGHVDAETFDAIVDELSVRPLELLR
jgi:formate dehydrogenase subunit gamma